MMVGYAEDLGNSKDVGRWLEDGRGCWEWWEMVQLVECGWVGGI